MAVLSTIVTLAFTFLFAFYLPGRLLLSLFLRDPQREETFPLSIALGIAVVNTLAVLGVGLVGLFHSVHLSAPVVWASSASITLLLLAWHLVSGRRLALGHFLSRPTGTQAALVIVATVAFAFFMGHYEEDRLREDACNLRATSTMLGPVWEHETLALNTVDGQLTTYQMDSTGNKPGTNDFLTGWEGQAIGPSIVLAPFMALFGSLGIRVVFGLQGLLLVGLGFLLGRHVLGRNWAAWATGLMLAFNPYALDARTFDENHIANIFGSLTLALLVRRIPAVALAGIAAGLFLSIRHVEVLALPFALFFLYRKTVNPRKALLVFLAMLVVISTPEIVMHILFILLHDGALVEGMFSRPPMTHSFLGWNFDFTLLLNYPFIDEPLRSPYHAFPTLFAFPLDIARRFGVLLAALIPAGMLYLGRTDRPRAVLMAGWLLPMMALLMVQSNWIEENKMGIPATALAPLILWMVGGIVMLTDSGRKLWIRGAWAAGGLAVAIAGVVFMQRVDAPPDRRVLEYSVNFNPDGMGDVVMFPDEHPDYVEWDRRRFGMNWLPYLAPDHEWNLRAMGRDWQRLVRNLRTPALGDFVRPMPDFLRQVHHGFRTGVSPLSLLGALQSDQGRPGLAPMDFFDPGPDPDQDTVVVRIDLGTSPLMAQAPLTIVQEPVDAVVVPGQGPGVYGLGPFEVSWGSGHPVSMLVARDRFGTVNVFLAPGRTLPRDVPDWMDFRRLPTSDFPEGQILLRLPRNEVIRLVEMRMYHPPRWYTRIIVIGDHGIEVNETVAFSPS